MHNTSLIFTGPLLLLLYLTSSTLCAQEDSDWRLYKPGSRANATEKTQIDQRYDAPARAERFISPQAKYEQGNPAGQINFKQDERIAFLDSMRKAHPSPMEGYRVQLFFGKRDEAQKVRNEFVIKYPNTGAYISYLAPNFRLRAGDFRSKLDSEEFKKAIERDFPGCYIVKDEIELPPLRAEQQTDKISKE